MHAACDTAVILFHHLIPILALPPYTRLQPCSRLLAHLNGTGLGGVLVHRHHPGRGGMARLSQLAEKAFCRLGIPARTQPKIARLALSIHGPIAVVPLLCNPDGRLINAVGIVGEVQVRSTPLSQFWSLGPDPATHRRMVDPHATFPQGCFHVAIAQRLTQIPPHGAEDNGGFNVAPFAQSRLMHGQSVRSWGRDGLTRCIRSPAILATEPRGLPRCVRFTAIAHR
jgi:hypothetical protein